ncbi:MAG: amidohydrolase family protein, partial [Gammaproteobacteria bacterium]|nr:amidohydrolase family protein [Gammaproteobacteria bacterium]
MKLQLTLIASALFVAGTAQSATLIHAGKLITADNDKVLTQHTVVVENDKIIAVESGYKTPA